MASTYLTETTLGTATDATKFTYSAWVKRSDIPAGGSGDYALLMGSRPTHQDSSGGVWLWQNGEFAFYDYPSANAGALTTRTSAKLFDLNAWYHLVVAGDASQSGTDKLKFYINGELQTAFDEDNRSSFATLAHSIHDTNYPVQIGGRDYAVHYYFNGYMSHVHFIDGTAYPASTFGSTDATTGEWRINTNPSVTYGNNGFFILKDGNSVTDQSGEGNNFTVGGGTLTKSEDNPSNVFATWNPLNPTNPDFANGNNTLTRSSNSWKPAWTTIGASSGKYYCEIDWDSGSNFTVGFSTADVASSNPTLEDLVGNPSNGGYITVLYENGVIYNNGSSAGAYGSGSTYVTGDIMMLAMDLDNNKFYFGKNGTWFNSADPANNTGGYAINASYTNSTWCFAAVVYGTGSWHGNFGNGYFGSTQIASAGTNASNIGIFEYDVPNGFTALSTKGLNE